MLWVKESRAASGVPEKIEDKATLTDIAALACCSVVSAKRILLDKG